jgi:hypothetical protein
MKQQDTDAGGTLHVSRLGDKEIRPYTMFCLYPSHSGVICCGSL